MTEEDNTYQIPRPEPYDEVVFYGDEERSYGEEEKKHIQEMFHRLKTEQKGTVPGFIVEPIEDPQPPLEKGDVVVTCNRCGNAAIVSWHRWILMSVLKTRSCTYCFKVSQIPLIEMTRSEDLVEDFDHSVPGAYQEGDTG